jgi:hypothetical protein
MRLNAKQLNSHPKHKANDADYNKEPQEKQDTILEAGGIFFGV